MKPRNSGPVWALALVAMYACAVCPCKAEDGYDHWSIDIPACKAGAEVFSKGTNVVRILARQISSKGNWLYAGYGSPATHLQVPGSYRQVNMTAGTGLTGTARVYGVSGTEISTNHFLDLVFNVTAASNGVLSGTVTVNTTNGAVANATVTREAEAAVVNEVDAAKYWHYVHGPNNNLTAMPYGLPMVTDLNQIRLLWISEDIQTHMAAGERNVTTGNGGCASPVVRNGKLYVSYYVGSGTNIWPVEDIGRDIILPPWNLIEADDVVVCVDAATGKTIWRQVHERGGMTWMPHKFEYNGGSPVVTSNRIFTLGSCAQVSCFDSESGALVWRQPSPLDGAALATMKAQRLAGINNLPSCRNTGRSLAYADGVVVVSSIEDGGYNMAGMSATNGAHLWSLPYSIAACATPVVWTPVPGAKSWLICAYGDDTGSVVRCVDPQNGSVRWTLSNVGPMLYGPSVYSNYMYINVGSDDLGTNAVLAKYTITTNAVTPGEVWRDQAGLGGSWGRVPGSSAIELNGALWFRGAPGDGTSGNTVNRLDPATGALLSTNGIVFGGNEAMSVGSDNLMIWHNEWQHGGTYPAVFEADSGRVLGQAWYPTNLLSFTAYSTPYACPVVDGRLYFRGMEGIYCYDLRQPNSGTPGFLFGKPTLSVGEGATNITVNIMRSGANTSAVSVSYATLDGSAAAGSDYTSQTGTLFWGIGDMPMKQVVIAITNDDRYEGADETFQVHVHTPVGGAVLSTPATCTVTIVENDFPGSLQFTTNAVTINESSGSVTLLVARVDGQAEPVSIEYETIAGTATAGADYTTTTGVLNWAHNDTADKQIVVPLVNDADNEGTEGFTVLLKNPAGGASAGLPTNLAVTVIDDEYPGELRFTALAYGIGESSGSLTVSVERVNGSTQAISVAYGTISGTATGGVDYTTTVGTLAWVSGETASKTFVIPILGDILYEGNETFTVALSNVTGGALLVAPSNATVTIVDDDYWGDIRLATNAVAADEALGVVTVLVERANGHAGDAWVDYLTVTGSASAADFTATSGTLYWANGDPAPKPVVVPLTDDAWEEADEAFRVVLTNMVGASWGSPRTAVVTIVANDFHSAPVITRVIPAIDTVQLPGTGSVLAIDTTITDDGLPNPPATLTVAWSQVSGPGTSAVFSATNVADVTVSFPKVGQYILRVVASDGQKATTNEYVVGVASPVPLVLYNFNTGPAYRAPSAGLIKEDATTIETDLETLSWVAVFGTSVSNAMRYTTGANLVLDPIRYMDFTLTAPAGQWLVPVSLTFKSCNLQDNPRRNVDLYLRTSVDGFTSNVWYRDMSASSNEFLSIDLMQLEPMTEISLRLYLTDMDNSGNQRYMEFDDVALNGTLMNSEALRIRPYPDTTLDVSEDGQADAYAVTLGFAPTGVVTVDVSAVTAQVTPAPSRLVFTPENWDVSQWVTNTAVDDAVIEALTHTVTNTHLLSSGDTNFDGVVGFPVEVRILDNDGPGIIQFTAAATSGYEEVLGSLTVTVQRISGDAGEVWVDCYTRTGTASSAASPADYTAVSQTLYWAAGDMSDRTVAVPVNNDPNEEATESFAICLTNLVNGIYGSPLVYTVTVLNNDTNESPVITMVNPINNTVDLAGTGSVVTLDTTVTDDGVPVPVSLTRSWAKLSGPGGLAFSSTNTDDTTLSFLSNGTYTVRLLASDGQKAATNDFMVCVGVPAPLVKYEFNVAAYTNVTYGLLKPTCSPIGAAGGANITWGSTNLQCTETALKVFSATKYFGFTVTTVEEQWMTPTALTYSVAFPGNGRNGTVYVRTSADNFAADVFARLISTSTNEFHQVDLSAVGSTNALEVRFYWVNTESNALNSYIRMDNLTLLGPLATPPDYDLDGLPDTSDPDDDNDGMPDTWESQYGLNPTNAGAVAQSDGDRLTDLEEYIAGSDPTNAASVFQVSGFIPQPSNTVVAFTFDTVSGRYYQVQDKADLVETNWGITLTNHAGDGQPAMIEDTRGSATRFYRIKVRLNPW